MSRKPMQGNNEASWRKRAAMAEYRKGLGDGSIALADIFSDPPEVLGDKTILELVGWARSWGARKVAGFNAYAVDERMNLAVPLAQADEELLRWLADIVPHWTGFGPNRKVRQRSRRPQPPQGRPALRRAIEQRERFRRRYVALDRAIEVHQRAVQGPVDDDFDIGKADTQLWKARERVRERDGETPQARELKFRRLWNAGATLTELKRECGWRVVRRMLADVDRDELVGREEMRP